MPYARTSDGIKIYYEEHGRAGTPLVLAYGIGGSVEMWDVNVAGLSAAHRLVLWEPRGHARSAYPLRMYTHPACCARATAYCPFGCRIAPGCWR